LFNLSDVNHKRVLSALKNDLVNFAKARKFTYYSDNVEVLRKFVKEGTLPYMPEPDDVNYHILLGDLLRQELVAGRSPITAIVIYKPNSEYLGKGAPIGGQFFEVCEVFFAYKIAIPDRMVYWIKSSQSVHDFYMKL
jgi:hypothetical protein